MRFLLAVWLITLLSLTSDALAARQPSYSLQSGTLITFEEYWELVRNTRQTILQMELKPELAVRQELNELASQWDQVGVVELPDRSVIQIESAYLTTGLRIDPPRAGPAEEFAGCPAARP